MTNTTGIIGGRLAAELASVTRLLEAERILNYSGHACARIPGQDALLIQRTDVSRAEVTADSMVIVGFDGHVLEGRGKPPSEVSIHIEILRARPDVQAILHCHMETAIAFTMMKGVMLKPMRGHAARWKSGIPLHPDPSHIHSAAQAQALAATLGPHHAVLMRAHGITLVSESVPALLVDGVHFDENARAQLQAMQAGAEPLPLTPEEIEAINRTERRAHHCRKLWNYYVRKGIAEGIVPADWNLLEEAS